MELRRALLLFAIVLGLAAIATSLAGPRESARREPSRARPATTPRANPSAPPAALRFGPGPKRATRELDAGRAATVTVEVDRSGDVEIEGLGLTSAADPLTPARFEVLTSRPDRHEIRFTPSVESESRLLGTLVVEARRR